MLQPTSRFISSSLILGCLHTIRLVNSVPTVKAADVIWTWGPQQEKAFAASKDLLTSKRFLAHYDSTQELTLAYNASGFGLGVVLAHKMPDSSDKLVCLLYTDPCGTQLLSAGKIGIVLYLLHQKVPQLYGRAFV